MSKIIPRKNNILIKPEEEETKTEAGLKIPTAQEKSVSNRGKIIALGKTASKDLKVGMNVIFNNFAGKDFREGEQTYYVVSDEEILVILK